MADYAYLIIGGGMTADAAVRGIRMTDKRGKIGILCDEPDPPYNRPPLSKGLWKGDPLEGIWCKTPGENLDLFLSTKAVSVDAGKKLVADAEGKSYSYDVLLIATGGRPRRLDNDGGGVLYYRTLADYRDLRRQCENGTSFTVIGGGFIGAEVAAALALNGKAVTMIVPQETIGGRVYPLPLGRFLNGYYREKGVEILTGESVAAIGRTGGGFTVLTSGKKEIRSDGIVAGIGIEPNMEIAARAGLATGNGIRVDEFLRTSRPEIFAAGDVAGFFSVPLGHNVRVEHEDNARTMGLTAGRNMAGEHVPYNHIPFFYSDMFDLGYEAVGELDAALETVADWKEEFREGVVYYMKEGRVRGVLLWNTWGKVDAARSLISSSATHTARDVTGLLRS